MSDPPQPPPGADTAPTVPLADGGAGDEPLLDTRRETKQQTPDLRVSDVERERAVEILGPRIT